VGEHVVPQRGLVVRLHLRQVEVGAAAALEQFPGVVEEVQPEVDQRADRGGAVHRQVPLVQVPAAGAHHDRRVRSAVQLVRLLRRLQRDGAADRVVQVLLAVDHVGPVRRVGVLQVGQPHLGTGVERVDRHLALGRAGDLHPPVGEVGRCGRDGPVAGPDLGRLGPETEPAAGRDLGPPRGPGGEQLVAARPEPPVQIGDERHGLIGQDLGHGQRLPSHGIPSP
jgi:hypothetical protein